MSEYTRRFWAGMFFLGLGAFVGILAICTFLLPVLILAVPPTLVGVGMLSKAERYREGEPATPEPTIPGYDPARYQRPDGDARDRVHFE